MALADQIVAAESGGNPNAQNPNSSAAGTGQFIAPTWLGLIRQYRPDLAAGKSDADILAMRSDPTLSNQMVGAYADQNSKVLTNNGFQSTPGNLYLAHFAGPQGAVNLLNADPQAPAASVMGPQATAANPFMKNMTVGQLRDWATSKVGGGARSAAAPTAAQSAPSPVTGGVSPSPIAPSPQPQGLLESAVDSELNKRLADVPGMLSQMQQPQQAQPSPAAPQMAPMPMPTPPAVQAAQMSSPAMQNLMNSPAAMLRRQILAMMQRQPQQTVG